MNFFQSLWEDLTGKTDRKAHENNFIPASGYSGGGRFGSSGGDGSMSFSIYARNDGGGLGDGAASRLRELDDAFARTNNQPGLGGPPPIQSTVPSGGEASGGGGSGRSSAAAGNNDYSAGERTVSYLGLGSSVAGSALSNFGIIRDPLNSAKLFIAGRAVDAASYIFGIAPSQNVNDYGGLATNSANAALSVYGAGGGSTIAAFGLGPFGVGVAGLGLGFSGGTWLNHQPVYGTNKNYMQWYGDAIWNKWGK